jgi:hypothetical protein
MISNFGPIAVALISWIVFNTIGKPLLRFFDLRTEVRRAMILYENVRARWRDDRVSAVPGEDMTSRHAPLKTRTADQSRRAVRGNVSADDWSESAGTLALLVSNEQPPVWAPVVLHPSTRSAAR